LLSLVASTALEQREIFIHDSYNAILKARQEGEEIGKKKQAIEIARQLLNLLNVETISKKTGLSVENICKLTSH
jgi:predicted transposase/invertase (TIGR01784 family)